MLGAERHPANPGWRWQAVCAEVGDKDIWYTGNYADTINAQAICMDCAVRQPCLEQGMNDEHGIWGGYTPSERQRLTKYLPTTEPARRLTMQRAAYVGPALFGVADLLHPLRTKEK